MKDYMDLAEDKANFYQKGLLVIVALGILVGLFISFSLSQEMIIENNEYLGERITYVTNSGTFTLYAIVTVIMNVIFGFIMQFFVESYKELVMNRYMTHHMLQVFEKAKIE